jgi:hypothetical protein
VLLSATSNTSPCFGTSHCMVAGATLSRNMTHQHSPTLAPLLAVKHTSITNCHTANPRPGCATRL